MALLLLGEGGVLGKQTDQKQGTALFGLQRVTEQQKRKGGGGVCRLFVILHNELHYLLCINQWCSLVLFLFGGIHSLSLQSFMTHWIEPQHCFV